MNINFEKEVTEYRIDKIERWVNAKVIEVDCQMILKFWNIVDDIFNNTVGTVLGILIALLILGKHTNRKKE